MIKKLISLWRPFCLASVPLYSFQASKAISKSLQSSQSKEFQTMINKHSENHITAQSQAQQQTNNTIKMDSKFYFQDHHFEFIVNTLDNMDLETMSQKNLLSFRELILKNNYPQRHIVNKIDEVLKRKKMQNQPVQEVNLLIKGYISGSCQKDKDICLTIKQLLKKRKKYFNIKTVQKYFTYLNQLPVPSQVDQEIRYLILQTIKRSISHLKIENLVNLAISLNSLSHNDFVEEELKVVTELFGRMEEVISELDQKTIDKIFAAKQYPSNKKNLSQLHRRIIKGSLSTKYQSASPNNHRLFKLISIAYNKLRPSGQDIKEYPLQYFIVNYVLENAQSKQKNIVSVLQAMASTWLSSKSINILIDILAQGKVKITPLLLYQLAKRGGNIDRLFMYSEIQSKNLNLRDSTLVLLALSNTSEYAEIKKQIKNSLRNRFQNISYLSSYINELRQFPNGLIKGVNKIFWQEIKTLTEDASNFTKENNILGFLRFKVYSLDLTRQSINKLQEYVEKIHPSIVQKFTKQWLKTNSPTNIGGVLYILGTSKQLIQKKSAIQVLLRANKYWRERILKRTEQHEFQRILIEITKNSSQFIKSEEIKLDYVRLITAFLKNYNSEYNQCNGIEPYFALNNLALTIRNFEQFPNLQILICKKVLSYPKILQALKDFLKQINHQQYFTKFQRQLIKVIIDRSYKPSIYKINTKNLPLVLRVQSLQDLLSLQRKQVEQMIKNKTKEELELYLHMMTYHYNDKNWLVYGCIFRQYYSKINIHSAQIAILFKAIVITRGWYSKFCLEIIEHYLKEIIESKRYQEEHFTVTVSTIRLISFCQLPKRLTHNYIENVLKANKDQPVGIIKKIYSACIFTDYHFSRQDLIIVQEFNPNRYSSYFFLLEQLLSRDQRQKILQKIVQQLLVEQSNGTKPRDMCVSVLQYYYLTKKYPEFTKQLNINLNQFSPDKSQAFIISMIPKWKKIADFYKTPFMSFDLFGHIVLKIKDTIIISMEPRRRNAIYQYGFMERLFKIIYGSNIKLTFFRGFPRINCKIQDFIGPYSVFTEAEWQQFLKSEISPQNYQRKEASPKNDQRKETSKRYNNRKKKGEKNL